MELLTKAPVGAGLCIRAQPSYRLVDVGTPNCSKARALPTSHGFGITKQPEECKR